MAEFGIGVFQDIYGLEAAIRQPSRYADAVLTFIKIFGDGHDDLKMGDSGDMCPGPLQ